MKIAKIAAVAMTVLCTVSFVSSCHRIKEEKREVPVKETEFTVGLNTVEAEYAEVVVRHSGAQDVNWYGFVTDNTETAEQELIDVQLAQLDRKSLHVGTSQTVALRNLQEYMKYRYIAFGVNESNEVFGTSGAITFSTNPNYKVSFSAEAKEVGSHEASFAVSHDGHEVLTWAAFVTEDFESTVSELAAADYASKVTDGKLNDGVVLESGNAKDVVMSELTHETDYRFIVYGIYDDGENVLYYGTPAEVQFTTPIDLSIVEFSAAVSNITEKSADVTVKYDAKQEDLTWYGFITDDLTTAATDLIADKLSELTADDFQSGSNVKLSFGGLSIETDYRFIATGVNGNGAFGVPAVVKFSTLSQAYVNTVFSVAVSDITATKATLTITHTGEADFQYYGFFTEDLESELKEVAVPENADANLISGLEKVVEAENLKPITTYRYVVVGRVNGNEYGTRGEVVFETADYAVQASYEDFLGSWIIQGGAKYEFVISEKVAGESYIVSGLNGSDKAKYGIATPLVVEGIFANGKFTVASQAISAAYVDPEDGNTYVDMFCGRYSTADGKTYFDSTMGRIVVTFALCEDGTVELRPGTSYSGETYVGMRFYQVPESGDAYAQDYVETALPNTAERAEEASEAYLKWIGDWNIGGNPFRIMKAETNVSYFIYGFYSNLNNFYALVDFDAATGNIVFHHRQMGYTVNSQDGTTYDMYTTGVNSLNYVAVRTGEETELAIFSLNASGNGGTVTGVTYMHSQGETTVTEIGLYGYASSWTKWNGWTYLTLPSNITKAEGTSVSAAPNFVPTPGIDVRNFSVIRSKENAKAFSKR